MNAWFLEYAASFSGIYFFRQTLVILALFILGFALVTAFLTENTVKNVILAFPAGLSAFIVIGYAALTAGIPYNTLTVSIVYIILLAAMSVLLIRKGKLKDLWAGENRKLLIILLCAVILIAMFAASGIVPISISNDSFYYFHEYPRDIVYFGHLRDQFDTFLTDVGLGAAVTETLPFLYGFNESFGIREFMHLCFIAFFVYMVYEKSSAAVSVKKAALISILSGMILAVSSPVWILGHWVMANMYFMELFFIATVLLYEHYSNAKEDSYNFGEFIPSGMIMTACALIRMEGTIFILFLIGTLTMLRIKKAELASCVGLILLLTGGYSLRIYMFYKIDNPYTFLTPQKALLQAAAEAALIIYICVFADFVNRKLKMILPFIIIAALMLANAVLFLYNRELYTEDIKAFYRNLTGQSGWGMLPYFILCSAIIIVACDIEMLISKRGERLMIRDDENCFYTIVTLGFALVTVAVSFMRGDALMAEIGDSGNRVLLQAAPIAIYTLIMYFIKIYERFNRQDNN